MSQPRLIYRNNLTDSDFFESPLDRYDPESWAGSGSQVNHRHDRSLQSRIRRAVHWALDQLDDEDRELIVRRYFMGDSLVSLARRTGRSTYSLEHQRSRVIRQLRGLLAPFVRDTFGIDIASDDACPICNSRHRRQIDRLISDREQNGSWRPVLREIRNRFGLRIRSHATLIGHIKYHNDHTNPFEYPEGETE